MEAWVEKARKFSAGPYAEALHEGDMLPAARFNEIAEQVAALTGLSVTYVKEAKLRIAPTRFRKELERTDGQILGRYDARFEGPDIDSAGENPGFDPSDTGISGPFVGAFHEYLQTELKMNSSEEYLLHAGGGAAWDWHHNPSGMGGGGGGGRGRGMDQPDTVIDLSDAMRKNPHLKVFSANGWFDLATPFFGTEHDLGQMMLPESAHSQRQLRLLPGRPHGLSQRRRAQNDACRSREVVRQQREVAPTQTKNGGQSWPPFSLRTLRRLGGL